LRIKISCFLPLSIKALQVLIQPILENLILNDRIAYLLENKVNARLISVFDDEISPRSICILAERMKENDMKIEK
jgi:hypothetical protein